MFSICLVRIREESAVLKHIINRKVHKKMTYKSKSVEENDSGGEVESVQIGNY